MQRIYCRYNEVNVQQMHDKENAHIIHSCQNYVKKVLKRILVFLKWQVLLLKVHYEGHGQI